MHTTTIPDETLRLCAVASDNHADTVREALTMVVQARTPEGLSFASTRLRHALVLLAAGEEPGAHDGSTFTARRDAAKQALDSWDSHKATVKTMNIRIGSTVIECEDGLAVSLGYGRPYSNDDTRTARGGSDHSYGSGMRLTPDQCLSIALSEGLSGEHAVMRAIAIRSGGRLSEDSRAGLEAAKLHHGAAEAELRAEQIRSARQKREAGV